MNQRSKRLLSILLSLVLVLGLMPGMNATAYAQTEIYTKLKNDRTVVNFHDHVWYIIADDSSSATAGTVTLLAADNSFGTSKFDNNQSSNAYSSSTVKGVLDALTAEGGAFASVKDAIADTDLSDVNVTGAKLYLLSTSEVGPYANLNFTGAQNGIWWLRSPGSNGDKSAAFVLGNVGQVIGTGYHVGMSLGVRPALKLNLSSVIFDSESNTFTLKPPHTHSFTYSVGTGENANTITATCGEGCDITEGLTLTISAPTGDLTADGTTTFPATLNDDYNTTAFPGTYEITYTKDGQPFDGTPTEAGEYTASVTVGGATASVSYTLTAPAPAVTYYYKAADGSVTPIPAGYTVIDANTTTWGDGWYVADGTVELGAVSVNGAANLVLLDGAELKATGVNWASAIDVGNNRTLNIYVGNTSETIEGSGSLFTTSEDFGIYNSGAITVYGGTVKANGSTGISISSFGSFTVKNGEVTAGVVDGAAQGAMSGITVEGSFVVDGGTVNAEGSQFGVFVYGGSFTVNSGTVNAISPQSGCSLDNDGSVNVNGGTMIASSTNGEAIYINDGSVNVTGGTMIAKTSSTNYNAIYKGSGTITFAEGIMYLYGGADEASKDTIEESNIGNYKYVEINSTAPAPSASVEFKGGSLRRRVYSGTTDVVDFETDIRFGFEFTLPEGATINMSDSYFCWKNNSAATAEDGNKVTIQSVDTSGEKPVANLILTGVPKAYYTTNIFCFVHVEYTLNEQVYMIETVEPYSRSVKQVCDSLAKDTTAPELWKNYAQSLLAVIG